MQLLEQLQEVNIHITGVPEGEKKEQEIGNLSEKIVKENFPNVVKESPNYDGCKEAHSKTHF